MLSSSQLGITQAEYFALLQVADDIQNNNICEYIHKNYLSKEDKENLAKSGKKYLSMDIGMECGTVGCNWWLGWTNFI